MKKNLEMKDKILLIGEACKDGSLPFDGRPGLRLASIAGLSLKEFLSRVEAVNLLNAWPGHQANGKGCLFPMDQAALAACALDLTGRTVILAGKRVAKAFGLADPAWLQPAKLHRGEASCHVIPHPSGIVRWYNDPAHRESVGQLLKGLLECELERHHGKN